MRDFHFSSRAIVRCAALLAALLLAACGEEDGSSAETEPEQADNRPPSIAGTPATEVTAGSAYSFAPEASDPDGDPLLFDIDGLPSWAEFDALTGELAGLPAESDAGAYRGIVLRVSDGEAAAELPAFDIVVAPLEETENRPPTISGDPQTAVEVGEMYRFVPKASDPDGDALSFTIVNQPPWASFDAETGTLAGTPPGSSEGTYHDIVIAVGDGNHTVTLPPFSITVRPLGVNAPPTISGEPPASVAALTQYVFTPTASDADGDALLFAVENPPGWATFDPSTGALAGTPLDEDVGDYEGIVISVTDGSETAALPAFAIAVTPATSNTPPTISGSPPGSAVQGELYTFTPQAADPDGDPLSFSIANRPGWADFDAATGRLHGMPGAGDVGWYSNIVISVSDGAATAALPQFAISVEAQNSPPALSGTPATSVEEGSAYSFTPQASDPDGDVLTFAIANRPSWASFDAASGRLAGTPQAGDVGTYADIVISATDGALSAALPAFAITVTSAPQNAPPTISGTPPPSVTEGASYSFTPQASDPDGDALTFSIQNRPSWASFSASTGRLQGTPGAAAVGTHGDIRISVSDGQASAALPAFSITVLAAQTNAPPSISGTPTTTVVQDTAYLFQPTASDPDGDVLTFTIQNRPSWASFSASTGRLQGTPGPGDVGTYSNIVIGVTDGEAESALPPFAIAVEAIVTGSATLTWTAPDQRTDGSALTNLAGFKVYWGTQAGAYPNQVTLDGPGTTTYVIENLAPGTWYFVTTAFDSQGLESEHSNVASKTIE